MLSRDSDLLNILMVSPQYYPIVGGYERAAQRLSVELARRGHRVTVLAEHRQSSWAYRELTDGVEIRRLRCLYTPHFHQLTSLGAFMAFLLIRGRSFDVWHVHQYGAHAVLAALMGKLLSRPVILKLTSSSIEGINNVVEKGRFSRISRWALRNVTVCIASSRETQREAAAFGISEDRISLIGNGIDTRYFRPNKSRTRSIARLSLGRDCAGMVVYVGRLSAEKNPIHVLEAWTRVQEASNDDWMLAVIGDGPLRDEVRRAIETFGLQSSVILAGHQEDVRAWLQASDLYILSSSWEGLSNTTLEAMSTGLPVIVTDVSGMREVVGETQAGIIVPPGDIDNMAKVLVELIRDPVRRQELGDRGRQVILDRYSIGHVTDCFEQVYRVSRAQR